MPCKSAASKPIQRGGLAAGRWLMCLAWALAVAGCAADEAELAPVLELGGADNSGKHWRSLAELEYQPPIIFGPQGGYHIWLSLRAQGLDPVGVAVSVDMTLVGSGRRVKPGRTLRAVGLRQQGPWLEFSGLFGYVSCPCQVRDRAVRVKLSATDRRGRQASAEATLTPRWSNPCNMAQQSTCLDICTLAPLASCLEQ